MNEFVDGMLALQAKDGISDAEFKDNCRSLLFLKSTDADFQFDSVCALLTIAQLQWYTN